MVGIPTDKLCRGFEWQTAEINIYNNNKKQLHVYIFRSLVAIKCMTLVG